ncbi:MAG TPA: flagella basal body P-ring formation protein FlgA [Ramlibacter sp.]|uniref:flagella basal body P-ring formation protein FlgA n=1 Tax=Ramlibacter sp. TaxID=1917967 RepID=UPI002ED1A6C6
MARILLCLLAWLVLPAAAAPRVSIELRADAQIEGPTIQLGEIARLHSPDLELMRQLVGLDLGRAPRPGESASIPVRDLVAWIERQVGMRADDVAWSGARESRVERQAARVTGEEIARAAQFAVQAMHQRAGQAHEVNAASIPHDLQVPRGLVRLQPRPWSGAQLGARTLVWVDVWVADALVRSVPVSLNISGGGRPRSLQHRWLEENGSRPGSRQVDAAAARLAVERGETAALRSVAGAVQLESRVQVLEDGRVGDLVRVRQQGAAALLSARVIGPGQVEVAP